MGQIVAFPTTTWQRELQSLGFDPLEDGQRFKLKRRGAVFALEDGWGTVRSSGTATPHDLGRPGLWRSIAGDRVFELPPSIVEPSGGFAEAVSWALATAGGGLPETWAPPPVSEVREWIPESGLTVLAGSIARQGTLVHEPRRLALEFEILPCLPPDLSESQRRWLNELLVDGQRRWRLVRVGLTERSSVHAEVDLSGAPVAVVEPLFGVALDALRWLVEWLAQPVDFLVNGAAGCRALEQLSPIGA